MQSEQRSTLNAFAFAFQFLHKKEKKEIFFSSKVFSFIYIYIYIYVEKIMCVKQKKSLSQEIEKKRKFRDWNQFFTIRYKPASLNIIVVRT